VGKIMEKSLYERLGGYNSIAAVVDDFLGRQFADKQVGRFYVGHSTNSKKRLLQLITEMICEVTGGPAKYIGRDMRTSHAGLGITGSDWQVTVKNLTAVLDKFSVPQKEKDELLAIVAGLRPVIVEI
jgi:hemoglobin